MGNFTDLQFGLLEKGIIDLQGDVDDNMFLYVRECLAQLSLAENPPIHIVITSDGGSAVSGLLTYDLLCLYPGQKTGTVIGFARSAAVTILQACDKRESTRNSLIRIHNPKINPERIGMDDIDDKEKWEKFVARLRAVHEQFYLIWEEKTKKPQSAIAALCKEDRDLSAQEALDFGLIDEII